MKSVKGRVLGVVNNVKAKYAAAGAVVLGAAASAHATVPAGISTAITDATGIWDDVMDFKVGVFVFVVILAIAYKMKGR